MPGRSSCATPRLDELVLHDDEHKDRASVTLVASLSRDAKDDALVRRRISGFLGLVRVCLFCSASVNVLVTTLVG